MGLQLLIIILMNLTGLSLNSQLSRSSNDEMASAPDLILYPQLVPMSSHSPANDWLTWTDKVRGKERIFKLVHWSPDEKVIVYMDMEGVDPSATWQLVRNSTGWSYSGPASWLFNFTTSIWRYMSDTYGVIGLDPFLHLILHRSPLYDTPRRWYSIGHMHSYGRRNVLDISSSHRSAWLTNATRDAEMDLIANQLAYFVAGASKGRYGSPSPSYNVWKGSLFSTDTAWVNIFAYDVYTSLNWTASAKRYLEKVIHKVENRPGQNTNWFKNWFLPIYTVNRGNLVLNMYFTLLKNHLPHDGNLYMYELNLGEFVHFWSGASADDLKELASNAFGWNETYELKLLAAKERFPAVTKLYTRSPVFMFSTTITTATSFLNVSFTPLPQITEPEGFEIGGFHVKPFSLTDNGTYTIRTQTESFLSSVKNENSKTTATTEAHHDHDHDHDYHHSSDVIVPKSSVFIFGVAGAIIIFLLVFVLILSFAFYKKKLQSLQSEIRALTVEEVEDFFEGDAHLDPDEAQSLVLSMPFIKDFEIPREQMVLDPTKILGTGQFATVIHGFVQQSQDGPLVAVAMKTSKPNVDVLCFKAFLSEVKIMAYLGKHENIVELLGTCTSNIQNREIFIALEFCCNGSLLDFLKKNRSQFPACKTSAEHRSSLLDMVRKFSPKPGARNSFEMRSLNDKILSVSNLLQWALQVSNAMMYLTEKKVIHGDLAARNILLTENRTAKISDFGLSRQFMNYANYMKTSKTPVPWRWLSIEALKEMKFSIASDVWAFGVTLWEIFSLGEVPYGAWTFDLFFADKLIGGDRLLQPTHANAEVYKLMTSCWDMDPTQRPSFRDIHSKLKTTISSLKPSRLEV